MRAAEAHSQRGPASANMRFLSRAPHPRLAPFVSRLWLFEGTFAHQRERIVPNGEMQLLVNLDANVLRSYHGDDLSEERRIGGASLAGVFGHSFGIDTAEQRNIVGVSFKPGGALPFFREPADATRNEHVDLDTLWSRDGALVRERLLEQRDGQHKLATLETILLERVRRPPACDGAVQHALRSLERGASIRSLVDDSGVSSNTFNRRFLAAVGLTPKRYGMLRRFQRVLTRVATTQPVCWADWALELGYFDQAHLIRDFRAFTGGPPSAYRPRSPGDHNHIALV